MKVYVHYEAHDGKGPTFTKRILLSADEEHVYTLQQLLQDFTEAYNTKFEGTAILEPSSLQLLDSSHKLLPLSAKVGKVLTDLSDVFVSQLQQQQQQLAGQITQSRGQALEAPSDSNSPSTQQSQGQQQQAPSPATAHPSARQAKAVQPQPISHHDSTSQPAAGRNSNISSSADVSEQAKALGVLQQYLQHADQAIKSQNFRAAAEIYQQVLKVVPDAVEVLQRLACLYLQLARVPHLAEPHARLLVARLPGSSVAHQLLGDCLMALGRPREAAKSYDAALLAAHADQKTAKTDSSDREADLKVSLARALYTIGQQQQDENGNVLHEEEVTAFKDTAAKLVMDVLGSQESHPEALKLYARIAEGQGMTADALQVALRLVVSRDKDSEVHALLARRLQDEDGIAVLYKELSIPSSSTGMACLSSGNSRSASHDAVSSSKRATAAVSAAEKPSSNNAAALAFLATCVKDHSAVQATITLLAKALELDPMHAGYALNLAHAWELQQRLDQAAKVAGQMYERVVATTAAQGTSREVLQLGGGVDLQKCSQLILALPALEPCVTSTAWWRSAGSETCLRDCQAQLQAAEKQPKPTQVQYSTAQLDLLALAFMAAKVLYVGGAVSAAAKLVHWILPARDASQQALHTTLIRNEAAYFGCVLQLLRDFPPSLPATDRACYSKPDTADTSAGQDSTQEGVGVDMQGLSIGSPDPDGVLHNNMQPGRVSNNAKDDYQPLYLVGDSHCLSGAWRAVTLRGQRRVLHPVLVTGCKIWHLRPASTFYPKAQFKASMAALPQGAQVVMVLGEIDCREGLLLAVQKCKYETTEDGIAATLDIYMEVLIQLIQERRLELFIHPVPSVLKETRSMVTAFNAALHTKIQQAAASPVAQGRLHYLDFSQELLTSDGDLKPEYHFDGTHLSPAYMPVLASHLAKLCLPTSEVDCACTPTPSVSVHDPAQALRVSGWEQLFEKSIRKGACELTQMISQLDNRLETVCVRLETVCDEVAEARMAMA